ncbi:MAG: transketolase [Bradyrhizobium sp.]|nr:transketolase [Bradyrhizobium sp.]
MSGAWVAFATTGNPAQRCLASVRPAWYSTKRHTRRRTPPGGGELYWKPHQAISSRSEIPDSKKGRAPAFQTVSDPALHNRSNFMTAMPKSPETTLVPAQKGPLSDLCRTRGRHRVVSMEVVHKAKPGHQGMPMGMVDVATVLSTRFVKYDPKAPTWADRDRFVRRDGRGSMLLYSLVDLTGFTSVGTKDIKNFRQSNSETRAAPNMAAKAWELFFRKPKRRLIKDLAVEPFCSPTALVVRYRLQGCGIETKFAPSSVMARFFFHVVNDASTALDDEGIDLPNIMAARAHARKIIGTIIADELNRDPRTIHLSVLIDDADRVKVSNLKSVTTIVEATSPFAA